MEGLGDFGSMDMSSYNDALNNYQSSLNSALDSVADANATAQEKVQKFNEAIQGSFTAISGPVLAKGFGKTLQNVKSAISKKAGQVADDMKTAAKEKGEELLEGAKTKVNDLKDAVQNKASGQTESENPVQGDAAESTGIDDQIAANEQVFNNPAFDPDAAIDEVAETNIDDAFEAGQAGSTLEDVAPGFRVLADVTREGQQAADTVANTIQASSEQASEAATEAASSAAESASQAAGEAASQVASVGGDVTDAVATAASTASEGAAAVSGAVEGGLAAATETAGAVAASGGGLNVVADLAVLGTGLGLLFTGLFAKKHAHTEKPPPAANPTFSFGT